MTAAIAERATGTVRVIHRLPRITDYWPEGATVAPSEECESCGAELYAAGRKFTAADKVICAVHEGPT